MYKLTTVERAQILTALVEGNSIASTCRMFDVNKITVLRLLADAGTLAAQYHDLTVCDLPTKRVQLDEIWAFVHCKQRNVPAELQGSTEVGDCWTWTAIDADSKLMIAYYVGPRHAGSANKITHDVAWRLKDRVQLTTDGFRGYWDAVINAFNCEVDFAQLVKLYGADMSTPGRYSPPECIGIKVQPRTGNPDMKHVSTSFVERQNLTMRMSMRRFTRLTNGFSKKLDNHKHAVALHYFHYNFIRVHQTIGTTPAVMAGVADKIWTMVDFAQLLEREENLLGGRLTNYKPNPVKKPNV